MPIKDDASLDKAHIVAQCLMPRNTPLAQDEEEYLEVLLDGIGKYEAKHYALQHDALSPLELMLSFMKDHDLKQVAMASILDVSSGVMNEIVKGKKELTKDQCVKLGSHFKISPAAFLPKALV